MSGLVVKVPKKKQLVNEQLILSESVNLSPDQMRTYREYMD